MEIPEPGDVIVTNNGMHWICATSATIREKIGVDLASQYANAPIKAYSVYEDSFSVWTGNETGDYAISEVIPSETDQIMGRLSDTISNGQTTECEMKFPEIGDVIVTRNGMRWICATSETIREKTGYDPDIHYAVDPIKAYSVDGDTFMTWESLDSEYTSLKYEIVEVIPAETDRRQTHQKPRMHSEMIKAWADGADIEWYDRGTEKWTPISGTPSWRKDTNYRIKKTRELVCHINSDGEIISVGSGNLSLTFNLLGELISAEVIKK